MSSYGVRYKASLVIEFATNNKWCEEGHLVPNAEDNTISGGLKADFSKYC